MVASSRLRSNGALSIAFQFSGEDVSIILNLAPPFDSEKLPGRCRCKIALLFELFRRRMIILGQIAKSVRRTGEKSCNGARFPHSVPQEGTPAGRDDLSNLEFVFHCAFPKSKGAVAERKATRCPIFAAAPLGIELAGGCVLWCFRMRSAQGLLRVLHRRVGMSHRA